MSPPEKETGPVSGTGNHQDAKSSVQSSVGSRQVQWWLVHEFLGAVLSQANVGTLPWAGTPEWCAMSDGDPRKLLALAVAGEHHVLRVEVAQAAQAEASRAISGAADWPAIAREIERLRASARLPRRGAA